MRERVGAVLSIFYWPEPILRHEIATTDDARYLISARLTSFRVIYIECNDTNASGRDSQIATDSGPDHYNALNMH